MNQVVPYFIVGGRITAIDCPDAIGLEQKLWVRVDCWTWNARIKFTARLLQPPDYSREQAVSVGKTEPAWVPPLYHLTADFELPVSKDNKLGPNILEVEFWAWDVFLGWRRVDIKTRENFVRVQEEPVPIPPPYPPPAPEPMGILIVMVLLMVALMILPLIKKVEWR